MDIYLELSNLIIVKILSFNTGYFLGYTGKPFDYLKNPLRGVTGSETEHDNIGEFLNIIRSENPDFVLAQEVDGGSIRTSTKNQHQFISGKMPDKYSSRFDSKYRGKLFSKSPMLKYMGNSVFYQEGTAEKHSLSIGRKNMVQEIRLDDLSIFSLHLSTFGGWIRKRQIKEIAELAKNRQNYILAGDLNLHKGEKERNYLEKKLDNPVYSPGKTFPAESPTRKLDLVASSENIGITNLRDLGNRFSDHKPIIFGADI